MAENPTRVWELLKKVKELADRGIEGEQIAARFKLDLLLKKYGVSLEALADQSEEPVKRKFWFKTIYEREILFQCYYRMMDVSEATYYQLPRVRRYVEFKLTKVQYIDLQEFYTWHVHVFREEVEFMLRAFHSKHSLYGPDNDRPAKPLSKEEMTRLLNYYMMLEDKQFLSDNRKLEEHQP